MRHRIPSHLTATLAAGLVVSQVLGCSDTVAPTPSAAIRVSVRLAGVYPFDGFAILVDHRPMTLLKTESSLVVRGLSAGSHTVALAGLASNCRNDGSNDVTVDTSSGELSTVEFHVSCLASTGAIAVAVSVSGYDRPIWFQPQVDSLAQGPVVRGNLTTVLWGSFAGGAHVVKLSGIPTFCESTGELSTLVDVKTGAVVQDTALASFRIECGDPPELGVDTAASIAFDRGGYVMVVRQSGGVPVALTEGQRPSWSPDGKLIAFERRMWCDEFGCDRDLWLVTPTGENQRPVLRDEYSDDYDAALSPGATKIAFIRFVPGPDMSYLAVSDLDGGSLTFLSIWSPVSTPSWSPEGTRIVFVCRRNSEDICLINSDKRCYFYSDRCDLSEDHITTGPGAELDPAWSHDGHRIAFTLACGGIQFVCPPGVTTTEPFIAVIDLSTRAVTRLVAGHDPAWSPDGSQLVFVGNASSPGLRVYNFADGSVRQLTNNPLDSSPSWRE
jgi:Tol biopolymer transport system component